MVKNELRKTRYTVSIQRKRNGEKGSHGNKGPAFEYPDVDNYAYNDGKITKKAIEKLKSLKKKNKPFFMALGYVSPHLPFIQPKKYWDLYDHNSINLANNPFHPEDAPNIAIRSQHYSSELRNMYLDIPKAGNLNDDLSRNLIHGYYASVSYMDALIGELIQSLDDLGRNISDDLLPFLITIPLQKLAYYSALKRGYDIDKPRNLAKSVTVE